MSLDERLKRIKQAAKECVGADAVLEPVEHRKKEKATRYARK